MLLLGQMFKLTPKSVRKRAEDVAIQVVTAQLGKGKLGHYNEAVLKARSLRPDFHVYKVVIRQYAADPNTLLVPRLSRRLPTWVHCSCDWFKFVCEVPLSRHKSSSVIRSNGAPTHITNPKFIPMVCKHIAAVVLIKPHLAWAGMTNPDAKNITPENAALTSKDVGIMKTKSGPFLYLEKEAEKVDHDLEALL